MYFTATFAEILQKRYDKIGINPKKRTRTHVLYEW